MEINNDGGEGMSGLWERVIESAIDAVSKTLDNKFDVIQTAQELNEKYKEK